MMVSGALPMLAALPFAAAVVLLVLVRNDQPRLAAALAGGTALAGCGLLAWLAPAVFGGEVPRWSVAWLPALGLQMGLRLDGLAWLFALLVLGIGALVVLYAACYLDAKDPRARFFGFLMLFMGAMLGVVVADNLVLLVVFWELTSLSSFLLIGYWGAEPGKGREAREGARMALTITGAGGLCLLAGVLLIGHIVGSTDLDAVLAAGDRIRAHALYLPALVLVLLGCFTKSAQFPFHFWLPHAMAAPTPVSAYLHSATMVKAGVFLLARLYPALGGSEPWFWIVTLTGAATLLLGAYTALFKHDLKGLLAYSTISQLGLITMLFGLDEPLAVVAGVFHILNHAVFKASLFMAAGIIDHETGSRDMRRLNGLWKFMPRTGALAMVASASMAGVPLLNGFLSKEMFFAETLSKQSSPMMEWLLPVCATLAGAFGVAYSLRFIHDVFFNGEPVGLDRVPHEPPALMRVPVELLVLLCLAIGLAPGLVAGPLLAVAARAALLGPGAGHLPEYTLALWHGFNLPLLMSGIAVALGCALYAGLHQRVNLHRLDRVPAAPRQGGRELFLGLQRRGVRRADRTTARLETGHLQRYLRVLVLVALAAGALPFLRGVAQDGPVLLSPDAGPAFVVVWAIGLAAAGATVLFYRQRLTALLSLGAVGLVVSLAFVHFSAPDLALTQLLVEVATVLLLMLALHWLPDTSAHAPVDTPGRLTRDALVALAAGAGLAALAYMVLGRPLDSISPFFLQNSKTLGGGDNAVNVIIVDFRGYDTLGEITVLGIAALVIHALLADWRPVDRKALAPDPENSHPLMLALVARLLLPLATLVAIYLYLRGHNLPGGGIAGGLVLAIALMLQFVASGQDPVGQRMRTDFQPWIGWGLLLAGLSGVASWCFGAPFLTTTYDYPLWPLVGEVPLASAAIFDLGVMLTVTGATMVALLAVARLSARANRAAGAAGHLAAAHDGMARASDPAPRAPTAPEEGKAR
jgi:multicomponent K+:H+ antiporter subunit A